MLTHAVLMQLRSTASSSEVDDLARRLRALTAELAGADSCVVGPNATAEPFTQGYDFGFVVRFLDREALAVYHGHPDHQPISDLVQRLSAAFLVFDLDG